MMQLDLTPSETAFQQKIRDFFAHDYPKDILEKYRSGQRLARADYMRSQKALAERGWLGFGWPTEFGGAGFTTVERYIFEEELEYAGAPAVIPMGVMYIGPIICAFGNDEQRKRWLPDLLASRTFWAQGYSEPESGSDLASLRTRAVRDGNEYIVNGEKIWTTMGHWADWLFCLVRTSTEARKQDGISMLCIDIRTPGIEVHPIITMDGNHELNRVTFNDVRVPVANLIGEEGRGWFYANELLKHERLSYVHIGRKKRDIEKLRALSSTLEGAEASAFHRRLAICGMEVASLELFALRALTGGVTPTAISALKILSTECAQNISTLFLELAGPAGRVMPNIDVPDWHDAVPFSPEFAAPSAATYLYDRAQTIYGGTNEVQKTIISRQILA